jgi:hypothetical protein
MKGPWSSGAIEQRLDGATRLGPNRTPGVGQIRADTRLVGRRRRCGTARSRCGRSSRALADVEHHAARRAAQSIGPTDPELARH